MFPTLFKNWQGKHNLSICSYHIAAISLQKSYDTSQAAAWSCDATLDLIIIWEEASVQQAHTASHQNKDLFVDTAKQMNARSHNQDANQGWIQSKQLIDSDFKATRDDHAHLI